jgi:hypothetical protein
MALLCASCLQQCNSSARRPGSKRCSRCEAVHPVALTSHAARHVPLPCHMLAPPRSQVAQPVLDKKAKKKAPSEAALKAAREAVEAVQAAGTKVLIKALDGLVVSLVCRWGTAQLGAVTGDKLCCQPTCCGLQPQNFGSAAAQSAVVSAMTLHSPCIPALIITNLHAVKHSAGGQMTAAAPCCTALHCTPH